MVLVDPSSSEDEDFFPTEDDVKRKCLQLEKEEFLKVIVTVSICQIHLNNHKLRSLVSNSSVN